MSLTVATALVPRCVLTFAPGGSSLWNKEDEEYRSTLGLHRVGSKQCHRSSQYYFYSCFLALIEGVKLDCKYSITLERHGLEKRRKKCTIALYARYSSADSVEPSGLTERRIPAIREQ